MSEGQVAGRLEIPVESDTSGFAQKLKAKIEQIASNIDAKIGVEIDSEGLRKRLEATVDEAAAGIKAKVSVDLDTKTARAKLEAAAKAMAAKTKISLDGSLTEDVRREQEQAQAQARRNPIQFLVDAKDRATAKVAGWITGLKLWAKRNPVEVDLRTKDSGGGGGSFNLPGWINKFGKEADQGAAKALSFFSTLTKFQGLGSLIQPAISAIGGGIGGLVAMIGNLGAASGTLLALPGLVFGLATAWTAGSIAIKGLAGNVKNLPKPLADVRRAFSSLAGPWKEIKKQITLGFWKQFGSEIKPVAREILPLLGTGLEQVAKTLGKTAKGFLDWAKTPLFQGQFKTIMREANPLTAAFGSALLGAAKGAVNLAVAARPLIDRIAHGVTVFGKWAGSIGGSYKSMSKLQDFMKFAGDQASLLWDMLKNLGGGLAGVFRAARGAGDQLNKSFDGLLQHWHEWVDSTDGQAKIKKWFDDMVPITKAVGRLIGDLGKALINMADDPATTRMLELIRTQLLPAVQSLLTNLSSNLAPKVISFFSSLGRVLATVGGQNSALSTLLGIVTPLLNVLGTFLSQHAGAQNAIGVILTALLGFKALSFLGGKSGIANAITLVGQSIKGLSGIGGIAVGVLSLSGAFGKLGSPMQVATTAFATFLMLKPRIDPMIATLRGSIASGLETAGLKALYFRDSMKQAGGGISGFSKALGGISKGGGLGGALKGLSTFVGGALGGPVGIGVAAVSVALGIYAQHQQDAAAKTAAHRQAVDEIVQSLDKETGALTEDTRATVAHQLQANGAANAAVKYGVSLEDLTSAALGNVSAQARVNAALGRSAQASIQTSSQFSTFKAVLDRTGVSQGAFTQALIQGGKPLADIKAKVYAAADGNVHLRSILDQVFGSVEKNAKGQVNLARQVGATTADVEHARQTQAQFNTMMATAARQLDSVRNAFNRVPKNGTVTMKTLSSEAEARLKSLGFKVTHMPDGTVRVSAATRGAVAALNALSRTRYATVVATVVYQTNSANRRRAMDLNGSANGNIFEAYANGGIRAIGNRVQAFADGAENHIAQIASAGSWRLWAEPETGGEAYIPLAESKRNRSMQILAEVAKRFGMALMPQVSALKGAMAPAAGALRQSGGAAMAAAAGGGVVFESGAIQITNPAPEPASRSISGKMRDLGAFGLFGSTP